MWASPTSYVNKNNKLRSKCIQILKSIDKIITSQDVLLIILISTFRALNKLLKPIYLTNLSLSKIKMEEFVTALDVTMTIEG